MSTAAGPKNPLAPAHDDAAFSRPVMRQTQALIGVMLLALSSAAHFIDPAWLFGPAVIGVALLVAGATGICPMAALIARLPWNRGAGADCCGGRCR